MSFLQALGLTALLAFGTSCAFGQPVVDYVKAPDDSFEWSAGEDTVNPAGGSTCDMDMTSQTWQGIVWKHRIAIARPAKPRHPESCLLFITGGNPRGSEFAIASLAASMTGMAVAVLGDIPNQPLYDGLNEDALISYTFSKYLETGDATWPLLFPMTKSAVRAMDALQALSEERWGCKLTKFTVTGASKRGWTTWFTGIVDKRAKCIIPLVYDNLNLPVQMKHHISQWGAYSEQIADYTERGLPDMLGSEEGRQLSSLVDPYTYRDQAKMPKLIVTGTNDRYWPLDAANDYFEDLPQPRYILYVPNSGHGLDDRARAMAGMLGFMMAANGEIPFPKFSWEFSETGAGMKLTGTSETPVGRVLLWRTSAPTKDFRDARWESEELDAENGEYAYELSAPDQGYAAFFFEFRYPVRGQELPLSTQVRIVGPRE